MVGRGRPQRVAQDVTGSGGPGLRRRICSCEHIMRLLEDSDCRKPSQLQLHMVCAQICRVREL